MAAAWAINSWATNSWVGMNGGPPNAWRGATTVITTPSRSGRKRGLAKIRRIEHERKIAEALVEAQQVRAQPVTRKEPPPAAKSAPAVEQRIAPVAQAASIAVAAPIARDLAAEVDFKMAYWSKFLMLVIKNIH
jgi:hypothetical protein